MDNVAFQKINDLLTKNDKVGIAVGKNPTLDEMAAALSLYLSLKEINKQVNVASPTQPIVEISNLIGIDKVKNALDSDGGDLIVSFPYQDRQIEKVSYNLDEDNSLLHIIVKAGETGLQFDERDVQFRRSGGVPGLLFIIGTPTLSDLDGLFDPQALKDTTVINIDNKANNQRFGDIVLVSSDFSSVSEQIGNLLTLLDLPIDEDIAQNLLAGISYATQNYQDPQTSSLAFELTAVLMRKGARRQAGETISRPSFKQQPQQQQQPRPQRSQSDLRVRLNEELKMMQRNNQGRQQFGSQNRQVPQPPLPPKEQVNKVASQNQRQDDDNPPSDWLEPKVYKGSTPI